MLFKEKRARKNALWVEFSSFQILFSFLLVFDRGCGTEYEFEFGATQPILLVHVLYQCHVWLSKFYPTNQKHALLNPSKSRSEFQVHSYEARLRTHRKILLSDSSNNPSSNRNAYFFSIFGPSLKIGTFFWKISGSESSIWSSTLLLK